MKNLRDFLAVFLQNKYCWHFWIFNESNILGKVLSFWKNWDIGVKFCWNYGPSKLLLHSIEYCLNQLNDKHTKLAVNYAIIYFQGRSEKKCLLKVFTKLRKSPLLMVNIFKGAVSGLRSFLTTESSWKIIKNDFFIILTIWICYCKIRFCSYNAFSLNQMSDICEVWKYWPLKDGFRSISQIFYGAAILWWMDQKTSNF